VVKIHILKNVEIYIYDVNRKYRNRFLYNDRCFEMIRLRLDRIEELRVARSHKSQAALARAAGWSPRRLNEVIKATERGEYPSLTTDKLNALCNALRCRLTSIVEHRLEKTD
jgi:DNA-binding Xre family transcriptional regulator